MSGIEIATIVSAEAAAAAGTPWLAGVTAGGFAGTGAAGLGTALTLGDAFTAISALATVGSLVGQAGAQKRAGEFQAQSAAYQSQLGNAQALQMEQQAGQERAVAQRAMLEERRRGRLVGSRAQAISAASGGGALDPSIVNILGDIDAETELRALTALYQGEERARGAEYGAVLDRAGGAGSVYAGNVAKQAGNASANRSYMQAGGELFKGGGSLLERFERRDLQRKYGYA